MTLSNNFLCFTVCTMLVLSTSSITANSPPTVTWETLQEFNFETKKTSKKLRSLVNETIQISGFIVPLELDAYIDTVKEFVLVPNPLACIHVPPPAPNQMILVNMKKAIPLDMDLRGVTIKGKLTLARPDIQDQLVGFELKGTHAEEADLEFDDPYEELFELIELEDA